MDRPMHLKKNLRLLLALWVLYAVAKAEAHSHGHPILCDQYDPGHHPANCPRHIGRNIGIILGVASVTTALFIFLCCRNRLRRARQSQSVYDHERGAVGSENWSVQAPVPKLCRHEDGSSATELDENPHWRPQLPSFPPPAYSLRTLEVLPPAKA